MLDSYFGFGTITCESEEAPCLSKESLKIEVNAEKPNTKWKLAKRKQSVQLLRHIIPIHIQADDII